MLPQRLCFSFATSDIVQESPKTLLFFLPLPERFDKGQNAVEKEENVYPFVYQMYAYI